MVTLFFNFGDAIKNQYLVYEIYINHMTNLMTKSELWDIWGGFTFTSPTAVCCLRHTRRKTMSNTRTLVKTDFILKNQSCKITYFWWKSLNWLSHYKVKNHRFLGILQCIFPCAEWRREELWKQAGISIFWLMGKSHISQFSSHKQIPVT